MDLNVLDHLEINIYSNIAAVLTETAANAWDADAYNITSRLVYIQTGSSSKSKTTVFES